MNKEILHKVDELITYIKKSKKYQDYQFLKEKLKNNKKANSLILEIKILQKEIVKKEINKEDVQELEKVLNEKLEVLNQIPLYIDFIEVQEELNKTYQLLKQELDNYFNDILN